jgi:hypothetical protein
MSRIDANRSLEVAAVDSQSGELSYAMSEKARRMAGGAGADSEHRASREPAADNPSDLALGK